jgi:hypothetical protein
MAAALASALALVEAELVSDDGIASDVMTLARSFRPPPPVLPSIGPAFSVVLESELDGAARDLLDLDACALLTHSRHALVHLSCSPEDDEAVQFGVLRVPSVPDSEHRLALQEAFLDLLLFERRAALGWADGRSFRLVNVAAGCSHSMRQVMRTAAGWTAVQEAEGSLLHLGGDSWAECAAVKMGRHPAAANVCAPASDGASLILPGTDGSELMRVDVKSGECSPLAVELGGEAVLAGCVGWGPHTVFLATIERILPVQLTGDVTAGESILSDLPSPVVAMCASETHLYLSLLPPLEDPDGRCRVCRLSRDTRLLDVTSPVWVARSPLEIASGLSVCGAALAVAVYGGRRVDLVQAEQLVSLPVPALFPTSVALERREPALQVVVTTTSQHKEDRTGSSVFEYRVLL